MGAVLSMFNSPGKNQPKGSGWKFTLYFTKDADSKSVEAPITLSQDEFVNYFEKLELTKDKILKVYIFSQNLFNCKWIPQIFGLWHEYTVVKSSNGYWSFEKNSDGICVQRSNLESVKFRYRGEKRINVKPEGRDPLAVDSGKTIQDIFKWIYLNNYLNRGYHFSLTNCHYFASLLFEAVSGTRGQSLDEVIKNVKHT